MKLLFYMVREHIWPFFLSLSIILFFFSIDFLIRLLNLVLSKNINFFIILEIFVLNLAWMISLSIPMACLITGLLAYGRLSADNELLALGSHGINPYKMLLPIMSMSIIICVSLIWFNNYVLPKANHRSVELKQAIIRTNSPAFIEPKTVIKDFKNYHIWIDSIDYKTNTLYQIQIYNFDKNSKRPHITIAQSGVMSYSNDDQFLFLVLKNGENHRFQEDVALKKNRYFKIAFKSQTIQIENINTNFQKKDRSYYSDRELSIQQMLQRANKNEKDINLKTQSKIDLTAFYPQNLEKILKHYNLQKKTKAKEIPLIDTTSLYRNYYKQLQADSKKILFQSKSYDKKIIHYKKRINRYWVEIYKKITLPIACILFALVGATLGMIKRKNSISVEVTVCLFLFISYWVCLLKGENLADNLIISPFIAMWTPNFIVTIVGIWSFFRSRGLIKTR